jgi:hypothetical protein
MAFFKSKSNDSLNSRLNAATDLASLLMQSDTAKALEVLDANEDVLSAKYWRTKFSIHEMRDEFNDAINSLVSGYSLGDSRCCTYLIKLIENFPTAHITNDAEFMQKLEKEANKLYESRNPELIWALAKLAQLRSDNAVFLGNLLSLQISIDEKHPAQSGGGSLMIHFIYDRMSHYLGEDLNGFLNSATDEAQISKMEIQIGEMFEKLDDEISKAWKVGVPDWDSESTGSSLLFIASTFSYFERELDEKKYSSVQAIPTLNFLLELTNAYYDVPKPMEGFSIQAIRKNSIESLKDGDLILYLNASAQPEIYGLENKDLEPFERDLESWGLMPYLDLIRQN